MSDPGVEAPDADGGHATRAHVRSSSLLLLGRLLATVVNFGTQVLIVRHLDKPAFGAFAYGLSLATFGETLVTLGLDRAVTRFVPHHDERGEDARTAGVILIVVGTIVALSVAFVAVVLLAGDAVTTSFPSGALRATVLVLVVLAPVQALDNLLVGLFAVFTNPRAIFFRRYVVAPGLRLLVVVGVVIADEGSRSLALGYLVAGAFGVLVYSVVLVRALEASGRLARFRRGVDLPIRQVFGFAVPLLSTDVVQLLIGTIPVLLLARYGTPEEVADVRSVQPVANLNQLVLLSFGVLFTPTAARLLAKGRAAALQRLYLQSGATVAVLTFPALLVSFSLAGTTSVALFGREYEAAGDLLAILALGQFVNAALGFNSLTLAVLGRVRQVVVINLASAALNVVLAVALIPRTGAVGAAVTMAGTNVAVNVLRQVDLRAAGFRAVDAAYLPLYGVMALGAGAVFALDSLVSPPLPVGLLACAAVSALVVGVARTRLDLDATFPELARVPLVGRLLG